MEERVHGYLYRQQTQDGLTTPESPEKNEAIAHDFGQELLVKEEEMSSEGILAQPDGSHIAGGERTPSPTEENLDNIDKLSNKEEEEDLSATFRPFTKQSFYRLCQREQQEKLKASNKRDVEEGRLVDGEIVFDDLDDDADKITRDPKLAEGQALPEKLGHFPKELEGVPIEEIDPHIKDKTFVIVSKKFKKYIIFRFTATKALFLLTPWNRVRLFFLTIITNQFFDLFILLTIAVNCVFMMVQPSNPICTLYTDNNGTQLDQKEYTIWSTDASDTSKFTCLESIDYLDLVPENVFQAIYTVELVFKIIARGFILNRNTYLRDGWNWLDFLVVVIAYVTTILEAANLGNDANFTALRSFRVVRALKSISVVPGLRTIVNALLKSLKMLLEVMLLTLFCIAIFALLALQFYMGVLRQKCIADIPQTFFHCNVTYPGNGSVPCFDSEETLRRYWLQDPSNYLEEDGDYVLCGTIADAVSCPEGYFCAKAGSNPNWGYTHFDSFGWAMLNTFQLVSLDFWEDTYNKIIDVLGPWQMLFFLMVVLLGSFYLLNLMLAVVAMAYEQEADVEAKEERAKAKRKENTALLFDPKVLKQQLLQRHKEEEAKKLAEAQKASGGVENYENQDETTAKSPAVSSFSTPNKTISSFSTPKSSFSMPSPSVQTSGQNKSPVKTPQATPKRSPSPKKRPTTAHGQFLRTNVVGAVDEEAGGPNDEPGMELDELEGSNSDLRKVNEEVMQVTVVHESEDEVEEDDEDAFNDDLPDLDAKQERYLMQKFATLWLNRIRPDDARLLDRNCLCCAMAGLPSYHNWIKWQNMVFKVANDGLFELFITLCILANTIIMGTEYYAVCELCRLCVPNVTCTICPGHCDMDKVLATHYTEGMPTPHYEAMNIANIIFTIIFTAEAIIKLTAQSREYFNVGWNIFDLVIVGFSLLDMITLGLNDVEGLNQITRIIKILRLMRIIKLAQSWSAMRSLLGIIFSTLGALLNLSIILLIIMFIFAVLGNQLFGANYNKYQNLVDYPHLADLGGELPRWHFNDFFHSLLMVFRVLCGEWVEPLWDCMRVASEAGCTSLFLATLILGNFMVLNLFLALLLNSFSIENNRTDKPVEPENKLKKSLRRIYLCFKNSHRECRPKRKNNVGNGVERKPTRLEAILDNSHRKASLTVNGSHQSMRNGSDQRSELGVNSSISHFMDDSSSHNTGNLELKPISMNGHTKSRSGSVISNISNGTHNSSGILKNKSPDMSPYNLQQIESAFSTHRDQYAKFETAVVATAGGCSQPMKNPIIITEDYSSENRKTVYIHDEDRASEQDIAVEEQPNPVKNLVEEEQTVDTKDDEDTMVAGDGHIVIPDCCCSVCHKAMAMKGCNCCSGWNDFRMTCAKIVTHKAFEGFILLLIGASSIMLCFEDIYLHEKPALQAALIYLNIVFAVFFFIEMILKQCALGLKKYFTGFWSLLDFLIVLVSIADIAMSYVNAVDISALRVLRTLRGLRPLRAVSRWGSMQIIVNALIFAMPSIANVFIVVVFIWLIFVIMGVQTFRGKFYSCYINDNRVPVYDTDPDCLSLPLPVNLTSYRFPSDLSICNQTLLAPLLGSSNDQHHWAKLCMLMGGQWIRPKINFDHVGHGYLALYQTATFEGWMEVLEAAIDAHPSFGGQAYREASLYWYIYFMIFIIFGAFFTLNLFIGVIIDNFNMLKKKYDGSYLAMFLTDNQRHYYNTLKKLGNKKPQKTIRRPKNAFQGRFYDLAVNTRFEMAITLVIFLNMVAMMIEYEPRQEEGFMSTNGSFIPTNEPKINFLLLTEVLEYINIIFTVVFALEATIKIIGLRLHYFRRAWNVFDFVVVLLSVIGIILGEVLKGEVFISPTLLRVVRVFRIGRVLRLVKAAKGIRKLLFALVISIPALFNIATLLFIFMFIFAIMGMTLFLNVRHQDAITTTVNFETFGRSMILLFRLCTSGGWNDVLDPLMEEEKCNNTHYIDTLGVPQQRNGGDCGNATFAVIFFLLYLFISFMIIINMYIAVILENFSQAHEQEEIGITEDDFDMFYVVWESYDPHATQYIKLENISDFIAALEAPLGIPKPNGMALVAFNLPIVEGDRIHCLDVLMALVKRVLHNTEDDTPSMTQEHKEANEKLKQQIADKYKAAFPQRQHVKVLTTTMQRKKEDVAAKTLQRAWRKHKMKQNIMRIKELALESSQRGDGVSRRISDAFGSMRSRIGSALGLRSRRSSMKSVGSCDSLSQLPTPRPVIKR